MSEGAFKDSGMHNKNTQVSYFACPWNDNICSNNRTTRTISRPNPQTARFSRINDHIDLSNFSSEQIEVVINRISFA